MPPSRVDPRRLVALRTARETLLRRHDLPLETYVGLRGVHRLWRTDPQRVAPTLAEVFDARRGRLAAVELGGYEASDL